MWCTCAMPRPANWPRPCSGLLTGESEGEGSDNSRSVLSALGGNTNGQSGQSSSGDGTSSTTGGSASTSGSGYAQGSNGTTSASTKTNRALPSSAGGVTIQADATTNTLLISAPDPLYRNLREVIDLLDQRRAQVVIEEPDRRGGGRQGRRQRIRRSNGRPATSVAAA